MTQTIIVWLIIGVSLVYLARHFYQSWQEIAKGKGGCGSCGNCPSGETQPIAFKPRSQKAVIQLSPSDSTKRPQ